jgi:hypothetical protein
MVARRRRVGRRVPRRGILQPAGREPQFAVSNPTGKSQQAAADLENRLDAILKELKANRSDDWDCDDFREAVRNAGYETTYRIPINDQGYWRYDLPEA